MSKPIANDYDEQEKLIDVNKPVRVYRNLHTGLWSVKQGTVRFHTDDIFLVCATFIVNEKHRQRVIAEKRKNVHAYVQGYLFKPEYGHKTTEITYNPYKYDKFICGRGKVEGADMCRLVKDEHGKMKVLGLNLHLFEEQTIVSSVATHLL
jgi:hypothetical protein